MVVGERYEDVAGRGPPGEGRTLDRTVAMQVIRRELMTRPMAVARLVEEAHATAQLLHARIVPV